MDPLTQGALGSAAASSVAPVEARWHAAALGWLAGMTADLDVLIRSPSDPLLFLEYHRQFTHALVFVPVGALVCALAAHFVVRRRLRFRATYLFCLLGYATHGLLDACTSYGTQLFWPFSDVRVAWNVVSVVDPLFTLPLLALLVAGLFTARPWLARGALIWALAYLSLGALQQARARSAGFELADARGHAPQTLLVKPSFGNLLVWKTVYAFEGRFYVDAVRIAGSRSYFAGERIAVLEVTGQLPWLEPGSRQWYDLERFRRFSAGFLALDPRVSARVIDVRYSMVPNRIDALWGIQLDPQHPDAPARFVTDRRSSSDERAALLRLFEASGSGLSEALDQVP
ncbi:MAG: metal-dependent hydrolase [Pseudomonadales bacterium]